LKQNPTFFGVPFTGRAQPKKPDKNQPYLQRLPDPIVVIRIYDSTGALTLYKPGFALNTVEYIQKSEIRITVSPDIRNAIQPYSIMVMLAAEPEDSYDYDIAVFNPGSQQYEEYQAVCNQTLPSGGKGRSRKMGWL
jgi:hypothetical protein